MEGGGAGPWHGWCGARPGGLRGVRAALADIGYQVVREGAVDPALSSVLRAFQRHWRPEEVTGQADSGTLARAGVGGGAVGDGWVAGRSTAESVRRGRSSRTPASPARHDACRPVARAPRTSRGHQWQAVAWACPRALDPRVCPQALAPRVVAEILGLPLLSQPGGRQRASRADARNKQSSRCMRPEPSFYNRSRTSRSAEKNFAPGRFDPGGSAFRLSLRSARSQTRWTPGRHRGAAPVDQSPQRPAYRALTGSRLLHRASPRALDPRVIPRFRENHGHCDLCPYFPGLRSRPGRIRREEPTRAEAGVVAQFPQKARLRPPIGPYPPQPAPKTADRRHWTAPQPTRNPAGAGTPREAPFCPSVS